MTADFSVLQGAYFRDLLEQPAALAATVEGLDASAALAETAQKLRAGEFRRVVLTGMGSSYHALHPLNLELIREGRTSLLEEASELVHYKARLLDPGTLLVVVSQSGRSAEILRLLEANQGRAAIIAITNTPDSPLAQQAGAAILTRAGEEFSVSCKTYVTSIIAVQWLAAVLCAKDLRSVASELAQAATAAEHYLRSWESHVSALLDRLRGIRHMFLCGRGDSLAAALTGSLIIKESTRFPAEGMSSAALRHGPLEMLGPASFVVIFAGSGAGRVLNERLAKDVLDQGARAELVADHAATEVFRLPEAPACVRPVLEILPVQMMTLALGAQAGREPGRFERASKVTTSE